MLLSIFTDKTLLIFSLFRLQIEQIRANFPSRFLQTFEARRNRLISHWSEDTKGPERLVYKKLAIRLSQYRSGGVIITFMKKT